ncbi:hypothetical protein [Endothiovibrio diazotrophicus]
MAGTDGRFAARAAREIPWRRTDDPEHPFTAEVDGACWSIRLNDFPAEPLYSLLIDGEVVAHFDDWPAHWQRPAR